MMMNMVQGDYRINSNKQIFNTKRSTQAELVGIDDEISPIIWSGYFLEEQGYQVRDNIFCQDNQITVKLAKNGHASSIKRTRHINV